MDTSAPEVRSTGSFGLHPNPPPSQHSEQGERVLGFPREAIIVAVGAVIVDDADHILLVKHVPERQSFWQGKWICPGGRLRVGEAIEEGILREIWEETHLQIRLDRPLVPFERILHGPDGVRLHVIYIDYLAARVGGELQPADDVGEALWVPRQRLSALGEELHEDTRRLLQIAQVLDTAQESTASSAQTTGQAGQMAPGTDDKRTAMIRWPDT
jgi:8-oxo-dGTP diphosphatase